MRYTPLLAAGLLAGSAFAAPSNNDVQVRSQALPDHWVKGEGLAKDTSIPVRVALKQQNLEKGADLIMEVSDPASSKYGQHYSADQVAELFAPKPETIQAVKNWLVQSGIPSADISIPKSKGWLDFTTTVGKLESMIHADYRVYAHASSNGRQLSTDQYSLPGHVSEHIDFVHPAMTFSSARKAAAFTGERDAEGNPIPSNNKTVIPSEMVQKLKADPASTQYCDDYVTPQCIRAFYNITKGTTANPKNRMGIYEDDGEFPVQSDLTEFYGLFATWIAPSTGPEIDFIDFGKTKPDGSEAEGEAALDFDMSQPLLYPQSTVLFQSHDNFGINGSDGLFNQFLDAVDGSYCTFSADGETGDSPTVDGITKNEQCGSFKPTNVISFSYGWAEHSYPAGYLERQCTEFMKLGLQGVTLVMSSGDGGVAGGHGGECLGKDKNIFSPQAATACPYVTSVGATTLPSGSDAQGAQIATTGFASGGGFSNVWSTPDYQLTAIESFFDNHEPSFPSYTTTNGKIPKDAGVYNRNGRGYPDVAANGQWAAIVFEGEVFQIGGTSMSAPIVASMFNRINEELLAAGKSTIGFANPALYANPSMFTDITIGSQHLGQGSCKGKAFSAVSGWDPVTGLGSPKYFEMLEYFMSQ